MATAKHINENLIHKCSLKKVELCKCIKSIVDMNYTEKQILEILDFFLFKAPVLKNGKADDMFGSKTLKFYGWVGNSDMIRLEGLLLQAAGMSAFCLIKSDDIVNTLDSMNLTEKICVEHPRAVLKQNFKVTVLEDGTAVIAQQESRLECLFRHIRNSLAHNHTYLFENNNILLEDCEENGKVSARILIPRDSLLEWIKIIRRDNNDEATEMHK